MKAYELQKVTYHITGKTKDSNWYSKPISKVWDKSIKSLTRSYLCYHGDIICFVLMSNHYHLLLKIQESKLKPFLKELNSEFFDECKIQVVQNRKYLLNTYKYIYQNPKRAGISRKIENYPYSTMFYLSRGKRVLCPVFDKFGSPDEFKLHWLNKSINQNEIVEIKKAPTVGCFKLCN